MAFAAASSLAPTALIVVAGFLPRGDLDGLRDVPVFWGHGKFDEWVPISRAKADVKRLIELGLVWIIARLMSDISWDWNASKD